MGTDSLIYKEYKLARDTIQLTRANVTNCQSELYTDTENDIDCVMATEIGRKQERISDNTINGYVKVGVTVFKEGRQEKIARLLVECRGQFKILSDDMSKEEQEKRIDLQIVPQLLPYVRSAINNMSCMMNIAPIILPTMDIINSIRKNR